MKLYSKGILVYKLAYSVKINTHWTFIFSYNDWEILWLKAIVFKVAYKLYEYDDLTNGFINVTNHLRVFAVQDAALFLL